MISLRAIVFNFYFTGTVEMNKIEGLFLGYLDDKNHQFGKHHQSINHQNVTSRQPKEDREDCVLQDLQRRGEAREYLQ